MIYLPKKISLLCIPSCLFCLNLLCQVNCIFYRLLGRPSHCLVLYRIHIFSFCHLLLLTETKYRQASTCSRRFYVFLVCLISCHCLFLFQWDLIYRVDQIFVSPWRLLFLLVHSIVFFFLYELLKMKSFALFFSLIAGKLPLIFVSLKSRLFFTVLFETKNFRCLWNEIICAA